MGKRLLLMCGVPGSGKSTLAKKIVAGATAPVTYVSRDEIRFALLENTPEYVQAFSGREEATTEQKQAIIQHNYFSKEKQVFAEFVKRIKEGLETTELTIADASHINEASRSKLLRALGTSLKDVEVDILVAQPPLEVSIAQNENRRNTIAYVPPGIIQGMRNAMTIPTEEEGFDHIFIFERKEVENG